MVRLPAARFPKVEEGKIAYIIMLFDGNTHHGMSGDSQTLFAWLVALGCAIMCSVLMLPCGICQGIGGVEHSWRPNGHRFFGSTLFTSATSYNKGKGDMEFGTLYAFSFGSFLSVPYVPDPDEVQIKTVFLMHCGILISHGVGCNKGTEDVENGELFASPFASPFGSFLSVPFVPDPSEVQIMIAFHMFGGIFISHGAGYNKGMGRVGCGKLYALFYGSSRAVPFVVDPEELQCRIAFLSYGDSLIFHGVDHYRGTDFMPSALCMCVQQLLV